MGYSILKYCHITNGLISVDGNKVVNAGNVEGTSRQFKELYKFLGADYPKFYKMDMLSKLAFLASEFLIQSYEHEVSEKETAILLTNSHSTIDIDLKFAETLKDENYFPNPSYFVYTLPNVMIGEISIRHNIKGETLFAVSDGFSGDTIEKCSDTMVFKNCIAGFVEFENHDKYEAFLVFIKRVENGNDDFIGMKLDSIYNGLKKGD